jgi:isoleucyl-tRNA synthetase
MVLSSASGLARCLAHGIVLGNDGQKVSKSRKNYPDVREVSDRDGSDAMRWFLVARPILRGGDEPLERRKSDA